MSARQRRRLAGDVPLVAHAALSDEDAPPATAAARSRFAVLGTDSEDDAVAESSEAVAESSTVVESCAVDEPIVESSAVAVSSLDASELPPPAPPRSCHRPPVDTAMLTTPLPLHSEAALSPPLLELLRVSERHLCAESEVAHAMGLPVHAPLAAPQAVPARAARRKARYALVVPEAHWVAPPPCAAGGLSMARSLTAFGGDFSLEISADYARAQAHASHILATGDAQLLEELLVRVPFCVEALAALSEHHAAAGHHEAAHSALRRALFCLESAWHPAFKPWGESLPCRLAGGGDGGGRERSGSDGRELRGGDGRGATGSDALSWRLLARAMSLAGRSGAPRAALEMARLLLQAGYTRAGACGDPARVLLSIDFFALRCGQPAFVVRLTGACEPTSRALGRVRPPGSRPTPSAACAGAEPLVTLCGGSVPAVCLPGLMFSRARALYELELAALREGGSAAACAAEGSAGDRERGAEPGVAASPDAPLRLHRDMFYLAFSATRMLVRALLVYPQVLLPLLQAVGLSPAHVGVGASERGGAAGATRARGHPLAAARDSCEWRRLFRARLFAAPLAELTRRRGAAWRGDAGSEGSEDEGRPSLWWTSDLDRLISLMIERQASLWRGADVQAWLFAAAQLAVAAYAAADALGQDSPVPPLAPDDIAFFGGSVMHAAAEANTAAAVFQELWGGDGECARALRHYGRASAEDMGDVQRLAGGAGGAELGAEGGEGVRGQPRPPGIWIARPEVTLDLASSWLRILVESLMPWARLPGAPGEQDAPL